MLYDIEGMNEEKRRCGWCNMNNPLYVKYHDEERGRLNLDEHHLFELLVLESFQAGLSWECILNKRESFRKAFDNFDVLKVASYKEDKIKELMINPGIIRNQRKIEAAINNAEKFIEIEKTFGSFKDYLLSFSKGKIYREVGLTKSALSDEISCDLKKRGFKFLGTTIIYSYLQAIGIINSHEPECFCYVENLDKILK